MKKLQAVPRFLVALLLAMTAVLVPATLRGQTADHSPSYPSTLHGGAPCGSCAAPAELSWKTTIAPGSERGERMEISGTIYRADGKTPAGGIVLFVYHTDATGFYNEKDDASRPRLRGWMRTGEDGRYQFSTIKPAPYPHRTTPAHVHAHVYAEAISEHAISDYWFAGDPFINEKAIAKAPEDGPAPAVVPLTKGDDGVVRGIRDITLD